MIALYSVGNVKRELKKIGRKLYIRDFAKFIFAYIEEDKLSLLTVQKITDDGAGNPNDTAGGTAVRIQAEHTEHDKTADESDRAGGA